MKQMKNFLIIFFLFVSFFVFSKQVNALEYISSPHSITFTDGVNNNYGFRDILIHCDSTSDYDINSKKDNITLGNAHSCHGGESFYLWQNLNGEYLSDIDNASWCFDTNGGDFSPCTDGNFNTVATLITNFVSVPIPATYSCSISDIGGCIASSLQYLFIPSDTAINDLTNLSDTIKNKPPIGYITGTLTALSGISATGTPSLSFASFTPLNTYIFTPLRAGLIWILWIVFLFLLFKRFSHFEL